MTARERFDAKYVVDPETGCWNWTAGLDDKGYGFFQASSRFGLRAHRWLWLEVNGPVPEGLELDHLCRNRRCCNPAHLEPVTHRENVLRGVGPAAINARKTQCIRGHELTPDPSGKRRRCVTCVRETKRRYKARNPERRKAEYAKWYAAHGAQYHRDRRARLKAAA